MAKNGELAAQKGNADDCGRSVALDEYCSKSQG
jgi:hypothetical protein